MIDVQLAHKLGLIGYRNHAKRLLDIVEKNHSFEITNVYHPIKKIDDSRGTNNLEELYDCDGVIIASPNASHFDYIIKFIKNSNCLIFCEKPPCVSIDEIEKLDKLENQDKCRIFFNFNFRFSETSKIIKETIDSGRIGKIIHINFVSTHGLAFKNEYVDSWRANGDNNLHNILETLTIHFLDLMNFHFGKINNSFYSPSQFSDNGSSFDTCHLLLEYENGLTGSILNSYATSYIEETLLIGTNGYISIINDQLSEFYPRDTFNSKGFFITPPIKREINFNLKSNYENSLKNSIDYFLTHIKNNKSFELSEFHSSLSTNMDVLNLKK